jgi:uncharacterized protein YabN with tetrapyrrole methylase and pyrophosphatase domain
MSNDAPSPPLHHRHGLPDGLDGLLALMERLLDPVSGCPWDRAQDLRSHRPYLLEETHEVLEAMDDPVAHRKELGDLLFQIVFQSALRRREGAFDFTDVVGAIRDKMIRRHPHVFPPSGSAAEEGVATPRTPEEVAAEWARIKAEERRAGLGPASTPGSDAAAGKHPPDGAHEADDAGPLAGVPKTLGALQRAWRIQDKAAAVGFDWPSVEDVMDKVHEELRELEATLADGEPTHRIEEELGDLLFVLTRLGTHVGVEPEGALRAATAKFERRFAYVVRGLRAAGVAVEDAGLARMEALWTAAKLAERQGQ